MLLQVEATMQHHCLVMVPRSQLGPVSGHVTAAVGLRARTSVGRNLQVTWSQLNGWMH